MVRNRAWKLLAAVAAVAWASGAPAEQGGDDGIRDRLSLAPPVASELSVVPASADPEPQPAELPDSPAELPQHAQDPSPPSVIPATTAVRTVNPLYLQQDFESVYDTEAPPAPNA